MVVNLSANLGAAFGAWFGGQLFDLSGSYALTFLTALVCGVLAIGSMRLGHTYRQQFRQSRDWPFGSSIAVVSMAMVLVGL
jgi:ABC-type spermidine/putrescine transport system permease subunit I